MTASHESCHQAVFLAKELENSTLCYYSFLNDVRHSIMTAAENNYPESVSRICGELHNLSTQMLELRRTQAGFPTPAAAASSGASDDTLMDVDQDEVFFHNKLAYTTA